MTGHPLTKVNSPQERFQTLAERVSEYPETLRAHPRVEKSMLIAVKWQRREIVRLGYGGNYGIRHLIR